MNRPSVASADDKRQRYGGPSTDQVVLWVQFLVGAGSKSYHRLEKWKWFLFAWHST